MVQEFAIIAVIATVISSGVIYIALQSLKQEKGSVRAKSDRPDLITRR